MQIQQEDGEAEEGIASNRRETKFSMARHGRREGLIQMRVTWGTCSGLKTSSRIVYIDRLRSPEKMLGPHLFSFPPSPFSPRPADHRQEEAEFSMQMIKRH